MNALGLTCQDVVNRASREFGARDAEIVFDAANKFRQSFFIR